MNRAIRKKVVLIIVLSSYLLIGCSKPVDNSPIIAQVGNSKLTLEEIKRQLGINGSELMRTDYLQSYVYRWVDNEIIYQSALSQGVNKLPSILTELEKLKRDLIIGYYIDNQISNSGIISEEDISKYYEENVNSFKRDVKEFRYFYLICKDRKTAQAVKAELLKEQSFESIVKKNYPENIFNNRWDSAYAELENVILSLQKDIARKSIGKYNGPVAGEGGYIIYQLVEMHNQGSVRDISLVKGQIIQRLQESRYRERYKELMVSLKSNKKIELNLLTLEENIRADTTIKKP